MESAHIQGSAENAQVVIEAVGRGALEHIHTFHSALMGLTLHDSAANITHEQLRREKIFSMDVLQRNKLLARREAARIQSILILRRGTL